MAITEKEMFNEIKEYMMQKYSLREDIAMLEFDENEYQILKEIYSTDILADGYWEELYEKYKDNTNVLIAMVETKKCPYSIVKRLIEENWIIKAGGFVGIDTNQFSMYEKLFRSCMKYPLEETVFLKIFHGFINQFHVDMVKLKNLFYTTPSHKTRFSLLKKPNWEKIRDDFDDLLNAEVYQMLSNAEIKAYLEKQKEKKIFLNDCERYESLDCISMCSDMDYLKNISEKYDDENILTPILNNIFLEPEIYAEDEMTMQNAFTYGVKLEQITRTTPFIKKQMNEIVISGILNGIDEKERKFKNLLNKGFKDSCFALAQLMDKELLDESYEYDLGCRLLDLKYTKNNELIEYFFSRTKHTELLKRIDEIKSADRTTIYTKNKEIDEVQLRQYVHYICNALALTVKKLNGSMPKKKLDLLYSATKRIQLEKADYEAILEWRKNNRCPCYILKVLAMNPKTPTDVLMKLCTDDNLYDKKINTHIIEQTTGEIKTIDIFKIEVQMYAKINMLCKKECLSNKLTEHLLSYLDWFLVDEDMKIKKFVGLADKGIQLKNIINKDLDQILNCKNEAEKLIYMLADYIKTIDNEQERDAVQNAFNYFLIKMVLNEEKEIELSQISKNEIEFLYYEWKDKVYLDVQKMETTEDIYSYIYKNFDFYKELNERYQNMFKEEKEKIDEKGEDEIDCR